VALHRSVKAHADAPDGMANAFAVPIV
jgi:hypothetical protein